MSMERRWLLNLVSARLSRRIVFWVFASIVVIEIIILIPSVYRRERELLQYLEQISAAKASGTLATRDLEVDAAQLLMYVQTLPDSEVVVGGALYEASGALVGTFGESPTLSFEAAAAGKRAMLYRDMARYDAVWDTPLLGDRLLIIRHDATGVRQEFFAFIGRIAGLVVIIAAFVTAATLIVLDRLIISPIMVLRRDLYRAGAILSDDLACDTATLPELEPAAIARRDELGDVNRAFQDMVQQIAEANAMRKQAEDELRLSEEKFSKAFHSSPNPVAISTLAEGRFLDVNDSFLALFGRTLETTLGFTVDDLNLWLNAGDRQQMIQDLIRAGFVRNREYPFRTASGERRIALYSAERIAIDSQDCLLSVFSDITERTQAEAALRDSELRFRRLVEQAADAFFVINVQGEIVDVNQQACDELGYTRAELLALTVPDIEIDVTAEQFPQIWQQLLPGSPLTLTGTHRRKDGSQFPVEVRVGMLDYGQEQLILALSRDISERRKAEEAQARLAEVGELASMIVHEVRNPLTTVLMGLNSFRQMDLSERAQMRLSLALEESERLRRLLNEILLYAKEQTLFLDEIEVNQFCLDLLDALSGNPTVGDRPIEFTPAPTEVRIQGDRDKLKQVLINLVSNACEAVDAGEPIRWQVSLEAQTSNVQIQIQNGGDPIPPEVLPRLTQPFFTTKSAGNGLGLAITKRIVEAHQGVLHIESSLETGTVVTVSLPRLS
jgi:PAS domain S-box-containing protein